MKKMVIGKYIRLSQADRDLMKKENKTESESISHQRDLIQNYIDADPKLSKCRQEEFFDDGYSGTNFDRPSFERLLEKIKSGEITCVVVKDFSRFGRDYIELGDYLERIFPFLGVRFISVNDHYDSNDYKGTTGGLDVVMKNIVYDYYSKDLSVKVKTAKISKMKQGLYLGGHVPYGLKRHPTIKGKLAIDEEAAAVVRKIFGYALEGLCSSEIATKLNEEGLETPGQYYCRKNPRQKKFKNQTGQLSWNIVMVTKILQQEMYYGAIAQHRREYVMPCSKVSRAIPKEEQIIIEGRHDPIVSKENWLKAQEVIRKISSPVRSQGRDYPLKGVARCGCCGRALQYYRRKKISHFKCNASKYDPNTGCFVEKIPEDVINEAVLYAIQGAIDCTDAVEKRLQTAKKHSGTKALDSMNQIKALQAELDRCEDLRMKNIERLNTGDMSKDDYLSERDALNSRVEDLKRRLIECQSRKQEVETAEDPEVQRFLDASSKYKGRHELTNDMVKAFIESVLIYDPERIEIKWNFSDRVLGMME